MAWRDQLRKASFRGAAFFVDSADGELGRRTVTHEYPLRDKPYVEDLGRKARTFTLEAYVIGAEYMSARDALERALEAPGPGQLVHPYRGELTVAVTGDPKVSESTREGGLARFTLTFTEAGENKFPTAQANTAAIVDVKASEAVVVTEKRFGEMFVVKGYPAFVSDSASDLVRSAMDSLSGLALTIPTLPGSLAELVPQIAAARAAVGELMQGPALLGAKVTGLIGGLARIVRSPLDFLLGGLSIDASPLAAFRAMRALFDFGENRPPWPVATITPSRLQQERNHQALEHLVQRAATIEAARASAGIVFESHQQAVAIRTELSQKLDALATDTTSDELYLTLQALRTAVIRDISTRGADLARVVSYTPPSTLPALVVAYELYEDPQRDADIVSRNRIAHPGFVSGAHPIEVLADA